MLLLLLFKQVAKQNIENLAKEKEKEKQKIEEARINKEKEETLTKIAKEYQDVKLTVYGKIYPYIERIY